MSKFLRVLVVTVVFVGMGTMFQNCGRNFEVNELYLRQQNFSLSLLSPGCDVDVAELYRQTYFPLLTQQCASCHTNGPGIGKFGSTDFTTSYNAFMGMDRAKVDANAVSTAHKPPYTGPINQSAISSYQNIWTEVDVRKQQCASMPTSTDQIATTSQSNVRILQNPTAWQTLSWDLDQDIASTNLKNKVHMVATIQVRVAVIGGVQRGYEFRDPSIRVKLDGQRYSLAGLYLSFNGVVQSGITTYEFASGTITSATAVNLSPGTAYAIIPATSLLAGDRFGLSLIGMRDSQGTAIVDGGTPTTPTTMPPVTTMPPTTTTTMTPVTTMPSTTTTTMKPPTTTTTTMPPIAGVTFAKLISNDATNGVFGKYCLSCHSGAAGSGGLDLLDYDQAKDRAALIIIRMKDTTYPMPRSGVLPAAQVNIVQQWINAGYPQ